MANHMISLITSSTTDPWALHTDVYMDGHNGNQIILITSTRIHTYNGTKERICRNCDLIYLCLSLSPHIYNLYNKIILNQ